MKDSKPKGTELGGNVTDDFLRRLGQEVELGSKLHELLQEENTRLPSPLELANIAASIGPSSNLPLALGKAIWLFLSSEKLCETFHSESVSPANRVDLMNEVGIYCRPDEKIESYPMTGGKIASRKEFIKYTVKGRTTDEKEKRFEKFFQDHLRKEYPKLEVGLDKALQVLDSINDKHYWEELAESYGQWMKVQKSSTNAKNARKNKSE
jgi:hypothetical protein